MSAKTLSVSNVDGTLDVLTGVVYASGDVLTVSGIKDDEDLCIVMVNTSGTGNVVVTAGDYLNGVSYTGAVASATDVMAWTAIDGTKYRQDNGTLVLTPCSSGTMYAVQRTY